MVVSITYLAIDSQNLYSELVLENVDSISYYTRNVIDFCLKIGSVYKHRYLHKDRIADVIIEFEE